MRDLLPQNLCVTFHCLYDKKKDKIEVNEELFIEINEIFDFCKKLKNLGYNFCLPQNAIKNSKNCVITFDDGYFNNHYFLNIAQELDIPFIIFLSGFNIENSVPFIWDLTAKLSEKYTYWGTDYKVSYEYLQQFQTNLNQSIHRPFQIEEINELSENKFVNLGYHGYYHQPFTNKFKNLFEREFSLSEAFMLKINKKINHFAFPNGLMSFRAKNISSKKYDFVYTINPGSFSPKNKFINRFSLINQNLFLPFEEQIIRANKIHRKIFRSLLTMKFSYT